MWGEEISEPGPTRPTRTNVLLFCGEAGEIRIDVGRVSIFGGL